MDILLHAFATHQLTYGLVGVILSIWAILRMNLYTDPHDVEYFYMSAFVRLLSAIYLTIYLIATIMLLIGLVQL